MDRFTSDMSWRDLIEALHALGLELQSLEYLQSIFRPDIAITAKEFETAKSVTLTGDVTGTDSSKAGWTVNTTLADTGVEPGQVGTYLDAEPYYGERFTVPNFKVDSKGRLTEVRETYIAIPNEVHDETKMVVGSSSSHEHAATTNGNTFINVFDTHTYQDGTIEDLHRASIGISGSGATAVASSASGGIVISSTDTNTMMIQNASTGDNTYPILLVATANASASLGAKTAIFGAGVKVNPKTSTVVATKFQGTLAGNASTATQFASVQSVTLTGDVTGTASSQAGWSVTTTLKNSGVAAGSYGQAAKANPGYGKTFNVPYITVNEKGIITEAYTFAVTMPADSHWTTKAVLGSTGGTVNAATTNGNTYFSIFDDATSRASFNIVGAGATTVASDANGKLTITSTDTNTLMTQSVSTANNTYPILLVAAANATANQGAKTAIFGSGVKVNPSTSTITATAINVNTITGLPKGTTWVAGVTQGQALINATTTGYGAIWNAPTKNYRVGCSTYPSNSDVVNICYSITNANVTAGTNTTHKTLTWDAGTGALNASGGFSGNAATATKFSTNQSVALTGDVTGSASSQAGWSVATTLANSGVTAGSYGPSANASPAYGATFNVPYITVDAKGRVTAASTVTVKVPADSHWTTKAVLGSAGGTVNAATTNGNTYFSIFDNSTTRASFNLVGAGATTVASDANGKLTITSTDTNTLMTQSVSTANSTYPVLLTATANATANLGAKTAIFGAKVKVNPSTGAVTCVDILTSGRISVNKGDAPAVGSLSSVLDVAYMNADKSKAYNSNVISYIGTDGTDGFNTPIRMGSSNGTTIVSAGESGPNFAKQQGKYNDESLYLVADQSVVIYTNGNNEATSFADPITFSNGTITAKSISVSSGLTGNASSATKLATARSLWGNNFNGTANLTGTITVSGAPNQFIASQGGYHFLIRNDGSTTYFMMSAKDGTPGTWSSARPLTIANSTGICNINGNAATATKFASAQSVALTGDVTGSASSQAGWSVATTLANSGVTAGSYGPSANATPAYGATFNVPYITVDAKGRVTAASTKTVKIPADSHWTTKAILGASDSTANAATTNGNTYFKIFDNSTARSTFNLVGAGATTVASDANGKLTITSTDTNTLMTQNVSTANNTYPILLVAAANATANQGAKTAIFGSGVKVNPGTSTLTATSINAASIELSPGSTSATNGGYLDFHYGASTADYTSRIIEDASGRLSLNNNTKITSSLVVIPVTLGMQKAGFTKGTNPTSTTYWTFTCCDQGGTNYTNNCLGMLETSIDANGVVRTYIRALANKAASTANCQITCLYDTVNNVGYTDAPTPAAGDNSNKIATTAWVHNATGSTKLKSETSGTADQAKILRPVAISNGNYSDVLVINCSENSAANRCSVIRVTNGDGYNEILLGVCNESNGAPGGISVRNTNGTYTVTLPGTTTGTFKGNVTGNCSGSSGSCTGNAATATKLATARQINGVNFDGTANITIADSTKLPLAGGTLTGDVTIQKTNPVLYLRNTSKTRGTAPSAAVNVVEINGRDNANKNTWGIYQTYATDKTIMTYLITYKGTTTDNSWVGLGIGYDGSGNIVSYAPTPAVADNSTKIATTAWVRTATGNTSLNAATATTASKVQANVSTGSYVNSIKLGAALVNSSSNQFSTIWNAPTKNYRVGCATWPDSGDTVYLCYSITNANVSSSTNTVTRSLTWNADTGILATTGFSGNLTGNCSGTAGNVTGVVAIANGGTGATTRLNAIKALTNENVSTNATHFLGLKSDWSKVGYFTLAEAKTLLGLKSAAYTESSAYATSGHTHSYLPLTGGTLTGQLTINRGNGGFGGGIKLTGNAQNFAISTIRTDYTKGTAPTAVKYWGIDFYGNAPTKYQNRVSMIETTVDTNNTSKVTLAAYRCSTVDNTGMCSISVSIDKNGNQVTYAPTPAAGDNSTKIATTAWVQTFCGTTKKYLTAHQSLAGYLKTYTSVSELGRYIDMHYDDATAKYDYDVRIYVNSQGSAKGQGALTVAAKSIDFGGTYNNGGTISCTNKYPLLMKNSSNTAHSWELMQEDANLALISATNSGWDSYPRFTMTKGGVAQLNVERCVRFQAFNSSPGEAYAVFITGVSESNSMSAVNCDWAFAGSNSNGGSSASSNHKLGGFHVYAASSTRRAQLLVKECGGGTTEFAWELELAGTVVNANFRTNGWGGYVKPDRDNLIDLGKSNYRWKQVFSVASAINTSDARKKDQIALLPDELLDAWNDINWKQFKMKDSIAEKGINAARTHTGIIAQEVQEVFAKYNLDPSKYGFFCHDEWDKVPDEITDEANHKVNLGHPAGDLYSIRYAEVLCIEAAYQRRRADRAEARISRIEAENQDLKDRLSKLETLVDTLVNQ